MNITPVKSIILSTVALIALLAYGLNTMTITLLTVAVLVYIKLHFQTRAEAKQIKLRSAQPLGKEAHEAA